MVVRRDRSSSSRDASVGQRVIRVKGSRAGVRLVKAGRKESDVAVEGDQSTTGRSVESVMAGKRRTWRSGLEGVGVNESTA